MIKKWLAGSGMILVVNSFAFWPLKKVYYITNRLDNQLGYQQKTGIPWEAIGSINLNTPQAIQALFLYDKHTSNWIVEKIEPEQPNLNTILKFLNCDFEYCSSFWEGNGLKSLIKKGEINKIFGYKKEKLFKIGQRFENLNFDYPDRSYPVRQELRSLSGVEIKNIENKVILNKDSKSIELTSALINYFEKNSSLNKLSLNKKELDRLKGSTILTVWCLIFKEVKEEKVESEMIGLARDNQTGKLFHWTTDLGKDVSILMQYTGG